MLTARCLRSILTAKIPGHIAPLFSSCGRFGENRKTRDGHLFFILLKSNYSISRLRPGNSVHVQRLADSLFVPFYFSMSFQSSRFAAIIPNLNPLRQAVPPIFRLIFHPKPQTRPAFSTILLFTFPFSLFTLHSFQNRGSACTQKSLIITKHFLDFKIIYGIIPLE